MGAADVLRRSLLPTAVSIRDFDILKSAATCHVILGWFEVSTGDLWCCLTLLSRSGGWYGGVGVGGVLHHPKPVLGGVVLLTHEKHIRASMKDVATASRELGVGITSSSLPPKR